MGGTPTKMAERDRFIKKKIDEWIKINGKPNIDKREKLVKQFSQLFNLKILSRFYNLSFLIIH